MPGTMTDNVNLMSLISIEVLIDRVKIDLNIECHLPCMVFRLLDYPAVSIPYFDQWQIEEFHEIKRNYFPINFMNFVQQKVHSILNVENHVYLKLILKHYMFIFLMYHSFFYLSIKLIIIIII